MAATTRRLGSSQIRPNRRLAKALLCGLTVLLVCALAAELAEGTFFLIGYTCNGALTMALRVAGAQLERLGLEGPLELVQRLCQLIEDNSLPVLAVRALRPLIEGLIRFVQTGRLALPGGVEEFDDRLREIVDVAGDFDLA